MTEVVRGYHGPACVTMGFSHRLAEGSMCYQGLKWVIWLADVVRGYHGAACVTMGFSHRLAEGSICYQELTWVTYG